MIKIFKKRLYFIVAAYFKFFASIQLALWKPRIVVITGSSGKTTLLHLVEAQLKNQAKYSHHANSSYGIPFDILGLKRKTYLVTEWAYLFIAAPFKAFKKPFGEKIYIVEADCDRPREGRFLASLLKPEVTLWASSSGTHSANFDALVSSKRFKTVEDAIAYEFGYFLEYTSKLAVVNSDNPLIVDQLGRSPVQKILIEGQKQLNKYEVTANASSFTIDGTLYQFDYLLPKEVFYSIAMTKILLDYFGYQIDVSFSKFQLSPGRSSIFRGMKDMTIIDSSYNATLDGMAAMLHLFDLYPAVNKWAVLGDMLEKGTQEQKEHERLAELLSRMELAHVVLVGPRVQKYTYPRLKTLSPNQEVTTFEKPRPALDYILQHSPEKAVLLFKGARFLEGIIEHLLKDKADIPKLCRRELVWQRRRKTWGL